MRFAAKLLLIMLLMAGQAVVCTGQGREAHSPDGTILAVAEDDCTVELRDASGDRIATLYEASQECKGVFPQRKPSPWVSFSPDGRLLAVDRGYGPLDLWRVQDRSRVASFNSVGQISSLAFVLDSKLILPVASEGKLAYRNRIAVLEVATSKKLLHVSERHDRSFTKVEVSPDGKTVAALVGTRRGRSDKVKVWDIKTGLERATLKGRSAEFSPDGEFLHVDNAGRTMHWNVATGNIAQPARRPLFTADNDAQSVGDNKWNWTVFISARQKDIDDIKCVEYKLHPSFPNPVRLVCEQGDPQRPFGLSATGWGTFSIGIRVFMKNGTHQDLKHQLKF